MTIDLFFSFFGLIIFSLLGYASWLGYSKGAIVQAISLFAVSVGVGASALATKFLYAFLVANGSVTPDLFAALFMGGLFTVSLFGANWIKKLVQDHTSELKKNSKDRYIGVGLSIVKMFLIICFYSFVIYKIEIYGKFLPESEQSSKLGKLTAKVMPAMFKFLRWQEIDGRLDKKKSNEIKFNENKKIPDDLDNDNF